MFKQIDLGTIKALNIHPNDIDATTGIQTVLTQILGISGGFVKSVKFTENNDATEIKIII